MKRSVILALLALGSGLLSTTEAEAGWPFGSRSRSGYSYQPTTSRFNVRQMHTAGKQTFRQNWGRIKGSADAAGFAFGSTGAKFGYQFGYAAGGPVGPLTGTAGALIGHESPAAVTGVSRSGYFYGKGFGREAWRQLQNYRSLRR